MHRLFLVGCPRSGTTIVQSLLGSHPAIKTFPETKLFQYAFWDKFRLHFPDRVRNYFLNEVKRPDLLMDFNECQPMAFNINWFLRNLDLMTDEEGKNIWIEKTPEHLLFLPKIERLLPKSNFIHVTRNGLDTVTSLWNATRLTENHLWGGEWSLNQCIDRWKKSIKISESCRGKSKHLIVKYEELLADKETFLSQCCEFIGVEYTPVMLDNYKTEAVKLGMNYPWHWDISRDIKRRSIPKHKEIFTETEVDYILQRLEF